MNQFNLINSYLYSKNYIEEGDRITKWQPEKRFNNITIPVVYLQTLDNKIIIVFGIHIRGSNGTPTSGLGKINDLIQELISIMYDDVVGIVGMGDFNMIPSTTKTIIKDALIMLTDYPTHISPATRVAYYDQTLLVGLPGSRMLPRTSLSPFSQAMIESIERARQDFMLSES